jgi:hypothetical protein
VSVTREQAAERLGFLAGFAQVDNPPPANRPANTLGWAPTHAGLIADIDSHHYFP